MYIFDLSIYGFHIAPTWYGLSYAIGFTICYLFIKYFYIFKKTDHIDILLSFVFFGIIFGWRMGYVLLYNPLFFADNPMQILRIWEWGMSFHGGFIGTVFAIYAFTKKYKYQFWDLIDTLAVIVPVAIGMGRVWNWINQELPGYTPYSGIFPMNINGVSHFPSPLLEMLLEGIILSIIMLLSFLYLRHKKSGFLSGIFLIWYSTARLISEQYRLPDAHIWYLFSTNYVTLWILYTVPLMLYGIYLLYHRR